MNFFLRNLKIDFLKNNPRALAVLILIFGTVFSILIAWPLSQALAGHFKVNQKIDLIPDVYIDFKAMGLGFIANFLGLEGQYPIGTISLRFYSLCILFGVLAGYLLALYLARTHFISGTVIDRLLIGLILFGIIGARLFFVLFNWEYYIEQPLSIITEITSGGLALFGALTACLIYIWIYCFQFKFSFYEIGDILAPSLLLGQIIGRWGNFFNYESYGPETTVFWKMFVPPGAPFYDNSDLNAHFFHPTFLYEIIPNFLLLITILYFYDRLTAKRAGLVLSIYALGYGIIRYFTEFFRADALKIELPSFLQFQLPDGLFKFQYLLISQLTAVFLIFTGIYIFLRRRNVLYLKKRAQEFRI